MKDRDPMDDAMFNLTLLLGAHAPEELLIKQLEEALEEYKMDSENPDRLQRFGLPCTLILTRVTTERAPGGVSQVIKDADRIKAGERLLDMDEQ